MTSRSFPTPTVVIALVGVLALAGLLLVPTPGAVFAQATGPGRLYLPWVLKNMPASTTPTPTPTITVPTPGPGELLRLISVADAYVFEAKPNANRGADIHLIAGNDEDAETMEGRSRSLLRFDVPLGASSPVVRATLRVYYFGYSDVTGASRVTSAYRAGGAWQQSTVTWAAQPPRAEVYGSVSIVANTDWGYREIDVTALVQQWIDGSRPNYGLYLIGPETSGSDYSYRVFLSREALSSSNPYPPELVIQFG